MAEDSYIFPLSFAQQRLWLLDRIAPGNPFYNIPLTIPIAAYLDLRALEKALNAIVARHESLRTTFRVVDNEPVQVIHPRIELTISVTDLHSLPAAERRIREVELATEEARKPFDLEHGPLIRCGVIVRGWSDYILLITMHHIVSDGWSMGVFMQELTMFYQSFWIGYPIKLPELPIQYPDFAVWQRDWLKGEVLETQLSYWREHLRDLPILELPTDHPRPVYSSYQGSSHPVRIGYRLSNQVRKFASLHGATPFMVLLSVFAVVLQRYSGHEEIVIGIPVANRIRAELEGLIGFFVNSLVLRIDFKGNPTFSEIVGRVREVSLAAYAHQDLPFEKLVEELHPSRDPSRNPLFQVTFQLVNTPTVQNISSSEPSTIQVQRGSAIFDLAFTLLDGVNEFSGILEYSTDLFHHTTIARIERHFRQLLQSALENPNGCVASQAMLSREEEDELINQSRGLELELPAQTFVNRLIAEQASRTPDAVAVRSGASELRYRALIEQSMKLANYLRLRGVVPEQCVGILMDRSVDLVIALLAVLESGAVYLPLDPAYPVERLRYMLADSSAKVILTQSGQPLSSELASDEVDVVVIDDAAWDTDSDPQSPAHLSSDNLCYVLYTSGSTGRPKGVGVPHSALTNHMKWMCDRFPLTETDRVLQRTTYSFDASIWEFLGPLMAGATLVMLPPAAQKDPSLIVQCLADGITVAQFVPSLLRVLLDEPAFYTCTSLRQIFCGGEAFDDELRERLRTSVEAEVVNLYGPTEATVDSTFYVTTDRSEPFGVPIGGPITNTNVYVLDQTLKPVPIGIAGEVYISGAALARGYLNQPAGTADRFLPDPYSTQPGARMYRTGDRARRLSDGALLFLGRIDDLVKVRGFRVELGEIEETIRRVEGVNDCAVIVEDSDSELARLIGFVVPSWEQSTTTAIEHEQVSQWEEVYREIYASVADDSPGFVGWNSSYTGLPIDAVEMAEWRASTVERIRKLSPSRVLEIGCGAGLLLSELASGCERYVGTDFSLPAVHVVEACVARLNGAREQVQLLHRRADDFTGFAPGMFDTVILNSVVQYFPSVEYLVRVIENAIKVVAPGGAIFIGDVRNLQLLEVFQLSLALHKLGPNADPAELSSHLQTAIEQEEELVIDPAFFYVLAANVPGLTGAEVTLKRGHHSNELTRFRYDVVLRVGGVSRRSSAERCIDWQQERLTLPQLVDVVRKEQPDHLIVKNIANARVITEVRFTDKLIEASDRSRFDEEIESAIHPEDVWQAPELQAYDLRLTYSHPQGRECFDLVLSKRGTTPLTDPAEEESARQPPVWERYANKPVRAAIARRLTASIRAQVSNQLPDYMVPSTLIAVDQLPLLPNGKLNRNALRALSGRQQHRRVDTPPRNSIEHALSIIWKEVLNTDHVDMRDDFFADLGGHSLLAMQLISRIREAFQVETPLKLVFQSPTIEQFASAFLDLVPEQREKMDNTASLFVRLSQMSETEIDAALARAAV